MMAAGAGAAALQALHLDPARPAVPERDASDQNVMFADNQKARPPEGMVPLVERPD